MKLLTVFFFILLDWLLIAHQYLEAADVNVLTFQTVSMILM